MKTTTRICNVKDLVRPLSKLLAPVLSSGEKVLICAETTKEVDKNLNAYSTLLLTQNRICYAFKDFTPSNGTMETIALNEVSIIERDTSQSGNPILVIYGRNGELFTAREFSSESVFEMFVQAMNQVGLSLKH